jgi:hypothetical protein
MAAGRHEQSAQRADHVLRVLKLSLHAMQLRGDDPVAQSDVIGTQERLDVWDGHPQLAQPPDDAGKIDLTCVIEAVARMRVYMRRHE